MADVSNSNLEIVNNTVRLYKGLNRNQKIIGIAVISLVLIGFTYLVFSTGESKFVALYTDLEQDDSGKIVEELKAQEIDYKLEENGSKILVPKDKVDEIRIDLAKKGLPENSNVGYEIFDRTNLGMSEFVQQLNYRRALEGCKEVKLCKS